MHLTAKQIELLTVIAKGGDGPDTPIDLDQILERVRYETTKDSLHFSIRALIKHALIEKLPVAPRRGRMRRPIAATAQGKAIAGIKSAPPEIPIVSTVEDDALDLALEILE